ncbi:MAG: dephospho-CoA kinase [Rickettsiales bacterium]|nr:dephospho-CoA kinase [Rickettsiales bacterium]
MIRIGLTGGIATGKSTVAKQFELMGVPRFDADQAVHQLLHRSGAVQERVAQRFPEVFDNGQIQRKILGDIVFHDAEALHWLEQLLHPAVRRAEQAFERQCRRHGKAWFIAEIPLLFEVEAQDRFDLILMTSCAPWQQRARAFARPSMTEEKYAHIVRRQMPTHEKRKRAHIDIRTGLGKADALRQVKSVIYHLTQHMGMRKLTAGHAVTL